jgi:hypothetical protein
MNSFCLRSFVVGLCVMTINMVGAGSPPPFSRNDDTCDYCRECIEQQITATGGISEFCTCGGHCSCLESDCPCVAGRCHCIEHGRQKRHKHGNMAKKRSKTMPISSEERK